MQRIGVYLHIPFCRSKCPYCDFYSVRLDEAAADTYTDKLLRDIEAWGAAISRSADSLYIGGGTPSVLGGERLGRLIRACRTAFAIPSTAEITVECNPSSGSGSLFAALREAGANRLSLGMQSAVDAERRRLGRQSGSSDVLHCVETARAQGFENISLDLMLGIPRQSVESALRSAEFCISTGAVHVSAYLLKLEAGTPFFSRADTLNLPDEDETCEIYHRVCQTLGASGLQQYEISNFAVPGYESRHNLRYWDCREYLGLGPGAHSYLNGRRFFYPGSLQAYLDGAQPVDDGPGGSFTEYAMLRLRLARGLEEAQVLARFGHAIPDKMRRAAQAFEAAGLLQNDAAGIRLTRAGFLLSNTVTGGLLYPEKQS